MSRPMKPGFLAGLAFDLVHVERAGHAALLALDQRTAEGLTPLLVLLEKTEPGADDVGGVGVPAGLDLRDHERVEVLAEDERSVFGHRDLPDAKQSDCTIFWYIVNFIYETFGGEGKDGSFMAVVDDVIFLKTDHRGY